MDSIPGYRIRLASDPQDYAEARKLFRAYSGSLDFDLCFQNFDQELERIENMYAYPDGGIFLVESLTLKTAVGCAAIRRSDIETAELKRMYLSDDCRGKGLGKVLLRQALKLAKDLGYKKVRLDTMPTMIPAIHLYKSMGFVEIPPYRFNPDSGALFFELDLESQGS